MQVAPLDAIYGRRFGDADETAKRAVWEEIVKYLQRFIDPDSVVLDLACDRGHFIRAVRAREKWATDARDVTTHLDDDVNFVQADGLALAAALPNSHFDTVFMSNYLEHLSSGGAVIEQLRVAREVLRPGGRAIVLQPNVRLSAALLGLHRPYGCAYGAQPRRGRRARRPVRRAHDHALPALHDQEPATESRYLVRAYLAFPPVWALLGKQTLLIAQR